MVMPTVISMMVILMEPTTVMIIMEMLMVMLMEIKI